MPTFTLAVSVRFDGVPEDDVVDALSRLLRPEDDDLLGWRDGDPTVLRLSTDPPAASLQGPAASLRAVGGSEVLCQSRPRP